jgi:hypothetical protein
MLIRHGSERKRNMLLNVTCRRNEVDGDEPRDDDEPLSAAAKRKSSVESDRLGNRRDDVRTKYCDVDMLFCLNNRYIVEQHA